MELGSQSVTHLDSIKAELFRSQLMVP